MAAAIMMVTCAHRNRLPVSYPSMESDSEKNDVIVPASVPTIPPTILGCIPVKEVLIAFTAFGIVHNICSWVVIGNSGCLTPIQALAMFVIIILLIVTCVATLRKKINTLCGLRELMVNAAIIAIIVAIVAPGPTRDAFGNGECRIQQNKNLTMLNYNGTLDSEIENVEFGNSNTGFSEKLFDGCKNRLYYVAHVVFFLIQSLLLDRFISGLDKKDKMIFDKPVVYMIMRHIFRKIHAGFTKVVDYISSIPNETCLLIVICIFEFTFDLVKCFMYPKSNKIVPVKLWLRIFVPCTAFCGHMNKCRYCMRMVLCSMIFSILTISIVMVSDLIPSAAKSVYFVYLEWSTFPFLLSLEPSADGSNLHRIIFRFFAVFVAAVKGVIFYRKMKEFDEQEKRKKQEKLEKNRLEKEKKEQLELRLKNYRKPTTKDDNNINLLV